jgi:hypothetical protein
VDDARRAEIEEEERFRVEARARAERELSGGAPLAPPRPETPFLQTRVAKGIGLVAALWIGGSIVMALISILLITSMRP